MSDEIERAIRAVWTFEAAKLTARLARITRDVARAEELAQDAFVAALETWPASGIPANPAAWLMTVAKNRALNHVDRAKRGERVVEKITDHADARPDPEGDLDDVGDDLLRLVYIACDPELAPESRVALTLRMLGGLTTDEIARAYLVPEATVAARITRAKKALAGTPFELPPPAERAARLASVLEVVYLIFNEGYAASSGDAPVRLALCEDALRLGRVLAHLQPAEPDVHGLVALMELHASRFATRDTLLLEQDRARWDRDLVARGLAALARARALAARTPYVLQAEISACHARAAVAADTDWAAIAGYYGELVALTNSPVAELNRAMAVAMADGPAAGLAILDALATLPALATYHWLPSARGDLLAKLGRVDEARAELARAADLAPGERDRTQLRAKLARLSS